MQGLLSPSLFLVLRHQPRFIVLDQPAINELTLFGESYSLVERQMGFYDFLRDGRGTVIGVRLSLFAAPPLLEYARSLQYAYVHEKSRYLEIYFREHRGLVVDTPAEQAFGDDALWRDHLGTYALEVGTSELSSGDLDLLRQGMQSPE